MSNNFALTVSGGVFTGFLVALLSEVREYEEKKVKMESNIIYDTREIYKLMERIYDKAQKCLKTIDLAEEENVFQREEKELNYFVGKLRETESSMRWLKKKEDEQKRTSLINIALMNFGFFDGIEMARIKMKIEKMYDVDKLREEIEKIKENAISNMQEIERNLKNFSEN